jgi:glycosyltransferase involved in cell wall biosynthesis
MMSKQYANPDFVYGWNYFRQQKPDIPFHNLGSWPSDILLQLCRHGHKGHFISIDTAEFMKGQFGSITPVHYSLTDDCQLSYLSNKQDFIKIASEFDVCIIRHDYAMYGELFENTQFQNKPVIQIMAGSLSRKLDWKPNCSNYSLLLNSEEEVNTFKEHGIQQCEIFKKPAASNFYGRAELDRKFDFLFVCWDTSVTLKRFQLFIDGISLYARQNLKPTNVLVVGDVSSHSNEIQTLQDAIGSLSIKTLGEVTHSKMPELMQSAEITVVCSHEDANPQVISESLACNTPVACAADITGGAYQINDKTGELFYPDAKSLCTTLLDMKNFRYKYQPAQNCITLNNAAEQIEGIIKNSC